jgi:hypothetical protein
MKKVAKIVVWIALIVMVSSVIISIITPLI